MEIQLQNLGGQLSGPPYTTERWTSLIKNVAEIDLSAGDRGVISEHFNPVGYLSA